MNNEIIKTLKILKGKFSNSIGWVVFGSIAVAIHNGKFHREIDDIDLIIENDKQKITKLFRGLKVCFKKRKNRERGYLKINDVNVELMFLSDSQEIDLADCKFQFNRIERKEFSGIELPVIDLQSLYCVKLRHMKSLEHPGNKKLRNTKIDIKILASLMKKVLSPTAV